MGIAVNKGWKLFLFLRIKNLRTRNYKITNLGKLRILAQ